MRLAAAPLLLCAILVGCDRPSPEQQSVRNNAAAYEASLRGEAANLEAMADAAADANAADAMRNAADELNAARRNVADVADAADARADNLQ